MKRISLLCLIMAAMSFTAVFAQSSTTKTKQTTTTTEDKLFTVVEQMPQFPGGDAAMMNYLRETVKYPEVAAKNGVQGRVVVGLVIEPDGSITNVQILRGVDPSLDREAKRVVSEMPKWKPGVKDGEKVRVRYQIPVAFRLQ